MPPNVQSLDTLHTLHNFDNRDDQSDYSTVWSTTNVTARRGRLGDAARTARGRFRLRMGALALSALLAMHCRVAASILTGGLFFYMFFLFIGVAVFANPMRHFEVYLGQWSISGPGRAFRIIPMFDGIGIAICLNTIVRALICSVFAALAVIYVLHCIKDEELPFLHCRDFNLTPYKPYDENIKVVRHSNVRMAEVNNPVLRSHQIFERNKMMPISGTHRMKVCKEKYNGRYPPVYRTPAYNFFYVEVVRFQKDNASTSFNTNLGISIVFVWILIWLMLLSEKIFYSKLMWNHFSPWFLAIPWLWTIILLAIGLSQLIVTDQPIQAFQVGPSQILDDLNDAFSVALYIHSASTGTEIIHGKGLNYYASGHIDPLLDRENVIHSAVVLSLALLHSAGAMICSYVDRIPSEYGTDTTGAHQETMLWIMPMYSVCASHGGYSHFLTALIFSGLTLSYLMATFIFVKTALHTIFEYKIKLVYIEQFAAFIFVIICMVLSLIFATNHGVALLESVESYLVGIATPFVCGMELAGLLYVYRSHDFVSDMNVATEENTCSTRISLEWRLIPFITIGTLLMKIRTIVMSEIPKTYMLYGLIPLVCIIVAVPLRACYNSYEFLRSGRR